MTLLDKIINESKIQEQLNAQLAEISYRAINGTRQAPRNFTEGILNVGTMNFKTPDDKITKEMIMDYQQKEQERYYEDATGKKLANVPTELTDALTPYTPIDYGTTGAEATEATLQTEQSNLNTLFNELETLKEDLKTKKEELSQYKSDLNRRQRQLTGFKADLVFNEDRNVKAKDALTKLTPQVEIDKPGIKDRINAMITETDAAIIQLSASITTLETEVINIGTDITTVEGEIIKIKTDITAKEKDITDKGTVIQQVIDNIKENKVGRQKNFIENKKITKKYEETFNYLNRNRNSVQQDPNEDDTAFIKRIASMEALPFNQNIFKDKAAIEGNRKFMENLKQITRDEIKISEISKSFPRPEDVFIINNNWDTIFQQLKVKFGINNPNILVAEYSAEITDIIDTLINKPFGTTVIPPTAVVQRTYQATAPPAGTTTSINHSDGTTSDFVYAVVDNSLFIRNIAQNKAIFIKIGTKNSKKFLMFSNTTNEENKFRAFNYKSDGIKSLNFNAVLKELKLEETSNKDIKIEIFGTATTVADKCDYLATKYTLTFEIGKSVIEEGKAIAGWGIKQEEVPKLIDFGKNILLLNKLYHKNILSVKNKKMHAVENFPNVKVSDKLVEIIYNLYYNIQPTKQDLDTLKKDERELFDLLLYVSGLSKKILTKKDDNINELKERLKLVEAQIRAGNNNPVAKSELKDIVHKLQLYNVISMNNAKNYLKQF